MFVILRWYWRYFQQWNCNWQKITILTIFKDALHFLMNCYCIFFYLLDCPLQHWNDVFLPINISSLLFHSFSYSVCLTHCNLIIVYVLLSVPLFRRLLLIYVKFNLISYVTLDHIISIHVFLPKCSCVSCDIWYLNI